MKRLIRKGFSMVELLFVMVILAALAAIAIPSMSSSEESTLKTGMTSDIRNIMNLIESKRIITGNYAEVLESGENYVSKYFSDEDKDGFADDTLADGTKIPLTNGNSVSIILTNNIAPEFCNGRTSDNMIISVMNEKTDLKVAFNDCVTSKIQSTKSKMLGWNEGVLIQAE